MDLTVRNFNIMTAESNAGLVGCHLVVFMQKEALGRSEDITMS